MQRQQLESYGTSALSPAVTNRSWSAMRGGFRTAACIILTFCVVLLLPARADAGFGLATLPDRYQVDTGAGLVFQIQRYNGNLISLQYHGMELQDQAKFSHIGSGFGGVYNGGVVTVTPGTYGNDCIGITVNVTAGPDTLTHYYMARRGFNNIYMATYVTAEPRVGELRYIARLRTEALPHCPRPSDLRGTTGPIESKDVFGMPNGETRSKYYGRDRAIDYTCRGVAGNGVGVYVVYGSRESSSGGPFYRDIQNQTGRQQELYNYMNSGHEQTEPWRLGVLYGPYVYAVTAGDPPALPIDTSWIYTAGLNLTGWTPKRGRIVGRASGIPVSFEGVVGFANPTAQYWCKIDPETGRFTSPAMKPGDYTMTLYKGELAVATTSVTVTQSAAPVIKDIASTEPAPPYLWRIGEWDGTPAGFLNADKILEMHPSDVRMSPWGPVTFTVGTSPVGSFPMAQWKDVNNPITIKFNLTPAEVEACTLRIGLTAAYAGGRPQVTLNTWTSGPPAASGQPKSRSLTVGTYRGNNVTYTYVIPASAFVAGVNTLTLNVISGSGGMRFLSPGYAFDALELDGAPDAAATLPKPTIFIVGDSTARNNANGAMGWGDALATYFDLARANVVNRAMAGRSTRTYIAEGRWDRVLKELKAGDFVLIQMGQNDGGPVDTGRARGSLPGLGEETREVVKPDGSKEVVHTYGWYLRKVIADTRARGATPILLSLTVRNLWRNGKVRRDNGHYAQWEQEIARAENVPFVDVTDIIADRYDAMGEEAVKAMFGPDYVHTSPAGADLNAASVVAGLKAIPNSPFIGLLSEKGKAVKTYGAAAVNKAATGSGGAPITGTAGDAESGAALVPAAPTPHQKPTLWLIGDSTVQVFTPGQMGWGTPLPRFFDTSRINIENRAKGGRSSRTFLREGLWQTVLNELKPGDYVLMQFGHNDRGHLGGEDPPGRPARASIRGNSDETKVVDMPGGIKEVVHSYGWYLRKYAMDALAKGAHPIIVSPIPTRTFINGKAPRNEGGYPAAAREAAMQMGIPFLDLNTRIADKYDKLGEEKAVALFNDRQHTTPEGAEFNAHCVAEGIRDLANCDLRQYLTDDIGAIGTQTAAGTAARAGSSVPR